MEIEINNKEFTLKKAEYPNGRLALVLFDIHGEPAGQLTVNLPHMMFPTDEAYSAFINHIDGVDYADVMELLEDNNMVGNIVARAKSGFNNYVAYEFDHDMIDNLPTHNA